MPIVEDPVSLFERNGVARMCMTKLSLDPIPALVDGIDNRVGFDYAGHPDRLYLVGRDGRIAYHGFEGPMGFDPDELEEAILEELAAAGTPFRDSESSPSRGRIDQRAFDSSPHRHHDR